MNKVIAIVSDKNEAREVLQFYKSKVLFFALSLEAEFFLEKSIEGYENPLYEFLNQDDFSQAKYFIENFKIARTWYKDKNYEYIQDRLGYFLLDLDRSLDFVYRVFEALKPERIMVPRLKNLKGYSVINHSLVPNAFSLVAKEKGIKVSLIDNTKFKKGYKEIIGPFIKPLIRGKKVDPKESFDVLFIVPPLKFLDIAALASDFKKAKIKVAYLTYGLTWEIKRKLDKLGVPYFLKEEFYTEKVKEEAFEVRKKIEHAKEWHNFRYKKHIRNEGLNNLIKEKIKNIVKFEIDEVLIDSVAAKKIIEVLRPRLLLSLTDPDPKCLPYINAAQSLGILTYSLEHGGDFDLIPFSLPKSDKYISWSTLAVKRLIKNNATNYGKALGANRILIGQSPIHSIKIEKKNVVSGKKIRILFLATINNFEIGRCLFYQKKLFNILSQSRQNLEILIRTHPFQGMTNFGPIFEKFNLKGSFVNHMPLRRAINLSDFVIFENTTAGLDSLLFGKPSIFFNPYSRKDFFELNSKKIANVILSEKGINEDVLKLIEDKTQWEKYSIGGRDFALRYLGLNRKLNKIVKLIQNGIS